MSKMYLTIFDGNELTFVIGVHSSEKDAKIHLASLIRQRQTEFRNLTNDYKSENNIDLGTLNDEQLIDVLFTDLYEEINQNIEFSILEVSAGEVFNFVRFGNWDLLNLRETIILVLNSSAGIPHQPHGAADVLLGMFKESVFED